MNHALRDAAGTTPGSVLPSQTRFTGVKSTQVQSITKGSPAMLLFRNIGTGWGAVMTALLLFSLKATKELVDLLERPGYYYEHRFLAIAVAVGAFLLIAVVGTMINRKKTVFDRATKRTTITKNKHTLVWVP